MAELQAWLPFPHRLDGTHCKYLRARLAPSARSLLRALNVSTSHRCNKSFSRGLGLFPFQSRCLP
jgi:hypothetical protein